MFQKVQKSFEVLVQISTEAKGLLHFPWRTRVQRVGEVSALSRKVPKSTGRCQDLSCHSNVVFKQPETSDSRSG